MLRVTEGPRMVNPSACNEVGEISGITHQLKSYEPLWEMSSPDDHAS